MARMTLRHVAALAGVSQSTASRVLNGRGEVRPEVRERVQQVFRQTGFRPLASARSLVSQRSDVIGFVLPVGTSELLGDPYFVELVKEFGRISSEQRHSAALFLFDEKNPDDFLDRVVRPGRVDGLIISAYHTEETLLDRLSEFDLPVVAMGSNSYPGAFDSVLVDNAGGGRLAAEHLLACGVTRPAIIGGPRETASGRERAEAFLTTLHDRGVTAVAALYGDFTRFSGYQLARDVLRYHRPDGIFAGNDEMAVGVLQAAAELGVDVPGDLQLIGFDDLPLASESRVPLTSIRQPIREVAEKSFEILARRIDGDSAPDSVMLPVILVERASTKHRVRAMDDGRQGD